MQLMEIEDQSWCPTVIRDGITDYLQFTINATRPYAPIAPRLASVIGEAESREVVDLCSGAGGPWMSLSTLLAALGVHASVTLSDRYPNVAPMARVREVSGGAVRYHADPVDATRVPTGLRGTRTMFSAFHHFDPETARAVLRDAAAARTRIAVFEATHRSMATILVTLLAPIAVLVLTPAIRPFRWSRLFWTYLVPAIPIAVLFDGIVSCLRTYTPDELLALTEDIDGYRWEAGETRARGPIPVTYLVGIPT